MLRLGVPVQLGGFEPSVGNPGSSRVLQSGSAPRVLSLENGEIDAVKCCGVSFGGAKWAVPAGVLERSCCRSPARNAPCLSSQHT